MSVSPNALNVCAAIVTFHPGAGFPESFAALMDRVPKWLIVDNRSSDEARQRLRTLSSPSVEVLENADNLGIAAALNRAARRAQALGFEWLLTFDQDSRPDAQLVTKVVEAYSELPDGARVGMIGCNFVMEGAKWLFYDCDAADSRMVERATVITSGSLLSLKAFAQVGPFREDLFIDGVDSEFCLRLRRHGYQVFAVCEPLMRHTVGELGAHPKLPARMRITHHSALRRYYITRNTLVVARQYWRHEPAWVALSLRVLFSGFVGAMLFERQKWRKLGATVLGIIDALRGRMGRTYPRTPVS